MKSGTIAAVAACIACLFLVIQPVAARDISLGQGDSGRAVSAGLQDVITVSLSENPTTGYSWEMTATNGLSLISDTYQRSLSKFAGAGGTHIWKYKVTETGIQTISGVYYRPWEEPSRDDTRFTASVQVDSGTAAGIPSDNPCPYGICKKTTNVF